MIWMNYRYDCCGAAVCVVYLARGATMCVFSFCVGSQNVLVVRCPVTAVHQLNTYAVTTCTKARVWSTAVAWTAAAVLLYTDFCGCETERLRNKIHSSS